MERVYVGQQSVTGNMMYQDFVYVRIGKMNNIVHLSGKYSVLKNDGNLESKEF